MEIQVIQNKIYEIRGRRVMLDFDIAQLYGIETRVLKQSVRRNLKRFEGEDFMFEITRKELSRCQIGTLNDKEDSRSQIVILNDEKLSRTQIATLNKGRGSNIKYLPFAFTELGVAMLSSVLHSDTAIEINRGIMRAFVALRQIVLATLELSEIRERLKQLERADEENLEAISDLSEYTREEVGNLYNAIGELSVKNPRLEKDRNKIGFKRKNE